jgi:hypothetical protein
MDTKFQQLKQQRKRHQKPLQLCPQQVSVRNFLLILLVVVVTTTTTTITKVDARPVVRNIQSTHGTYKYVFFGYPYPLLVL